MSHMGGTNGRGGGGAVRESILGMGQTALEDMRIM